MVLVVLILIIGIKSIYKYIKTSIITYYLYKYLENILLFIINKRVDHANNKVTRKSIIQKVIIYL